MKEAIEKAIKANAEKSASAKAPCDAMQYSQAAVTLANALEALGNIKK